MVRYILVILLCVLAGAIPVAAAGVTVEITASGYSPALLAVAPDTTVFWHNGTSSPHSVTADDGSFDSGAIPTMFGSWSHTFSTPGRYAYHDGGDPSRTGLVIVGNASLPITYLPLMQAVPPPPPPLDQLLLHFADVGYAFGRTDLTITPGMPDDAYESHGHVAYERRDTLYRGAIVIDQDLWRYTTADGAAAAFARLAAADFGTDWKRADMATVGDQSAAWTAAQVTKDGYTLRVFSVVAQHGQYVTLVFSGGLEGQVTTVSAYDLTVLAMAKLP